MKWKPNYVFGNTNLENLLKSNIKKIKSKLFEVGEFVTISTNVIDWNEYVETPNELKQGKYSPLTYFTPAQNNYPAYGTKFSADLIIENNSLVINFGVAGVPVNL
jgi:hypothetical protein